MKMNKAMGQMISQAVEVFARGFSYTRSFTHPFPAERMEKLWVIRDAPRQRGNYRREEWVAYALSAQEIDQTARRHTRGHFVVCAICAEGEDQRQLRADFKTLNYRLITTEPLMIHPLVDIPPFSSPATIERVMTAEWATPLAKAARAQQILPQHFVEDAPLRQYVALLDQQLVGWVRSIVVDNATWCSDMFVKPEFRRRGIARALLSRLLQDDHSHGASQAVLLASHTGAKLYPVVGYQQIGTLLLYAPKR